MLRISFYCGTIMRHGQGVICTDFFNIHEFVAFVQFRCKTFTYHYSSIKNAGAMVSFAVRQKLSLIGFFRGEYDDYV